MAEQHPELVVAFMKGMIKVGRWANEHKHAAAAILDKQTFYLDVEDTYEGIKHIDMVPNLSPQNLVSVEIGKDFMLSHGYIAKTTWTCISGRHQNSWKKQQGNYWKKNGRKGLLQNFPRQLRRCNQENGSASQGKAQLEACALIPGGFH